MSENTTMRSRWSVSPDTQKIAVRIGPGPVTFYFQDINGRRSRRLLNATSIGGARSKKQVRTQYPKVKFV